MEDGTQHEIFPWLNPQDQGRKHERRRAQQTGARLQPGSGNQPGRKQDMRHRDFLEQTKWTTKGSFVLRAADFLRIKDDATTEGRSPQLAITFSGANPDGSDLTILVRESGDFE